jgi:broad specificity phosphatase PhoE
MEMAKKLVLIRHASIGEAFQGRFIGSTDVPLSVEGSRQASRLADVLQKMSQGACISSPMQRTLETARSAAIPLGLQFDIDPDLREIDFGLFEGLTFEEIDLRYPEQVSVWTGLEPNFVFLERIHRVGSRMASCEDETVIAFTHGGVIRALICYFLGLDPSHYVLFDVDHASITTIRLFGESGVLAGLNDTSHLRGI